MKKTGFKICRSFKKQILAIFSEPQYVYRNLSHAKIVAHMKADEYYATKFTEWEKIIIYDENKNIVASVSNKNFNVIGALVNEG